MELLERLSFFGCGLTVTWLYHTRCVFRRSSGQAQHHGHVSSPSAGEYVTAVFSGFVSFRVVIFVAQLLPLAAVVTLSDKRVGTVGSPLGCLVVVLVACSVPVD